MKIFTLFLKTILIFVGIFAFWKIGLGEERQKLTQEKFAEIMVKNMKLQNRLPLAALPSDSVDLLESLGISPLKGWRRKSFLTQGDYVTIIAKASGKERVVYKNAVDVCQCNENFINQQWKENYRISGNWISLSQFFKNKEIFPYGTPLCPFGLKYEDKDGDHIVDHHYHSAANLLRASKSTSAK